MTNRTMDSVRSRLGLGTAAIGRPAYMTLGHAGDFPEGRSPQAMERHAHALFDAAYASGIRYFDAARSYGRAEAFLRSWLDARGIRPGDVVVGSKWGYRYTGGWQIDADTHEEKDHSVEALREQLPRSRDVLGPHLALYQIHSATPDTGVLENDAVLDELARARDEGLRIGLTLSGPSQAATLRRALQIQRGGSALFSSVQATWNLYERSCEEALREAREAGWNVILKEIFANGRLSPRGDATDGPLGELARELDVTVDAIAVAAALAQAYAGTVLLGAATVAQLSSNLRGADVELPRGSLDRLDGLREDSASYWQTRSAIPWD